MADKIVYTLDTKTENAIDHYQLWDLVVPALFSFLDFETRAELKLDATYGADRGRVVFKGERTATGSPKSGTFAIYGTPGSLVYLNKLLKIFGLDQFVDGENFILEQDFQRDIHYRVIKPDQALLDGVIKSHRDKFQENPSELRIRGWIKCKPNSRRLKIS